MKGELEKSPFHVLEETLVVWEERKKEWEKEENITKGKKIVANSL